MNILVTCEESQVVCKAFRAKGHRVFSCDIEPCSGGCPEWHIQDDVLRLLGGNCEFETTDGNKHLQSGKWDMIIAHPLCTYLSNAGAARLFPKKGLMDVERFKKGLEGKKFFMKFLNADCEKICVENPIQTSIFEIPKYTQIIEPWQFGHPYLKKTCLWLKGLNNLIPDIKEKPDNTISWVSGGSKDASGNPRKQCGTKIRDAKSRSKTFQGIGSAMAEQWG